jgi:hypothetical protein
MFSQNAPPKYDEFFRYYVNSDFSNAKKIANEIISDNSGIYPESDSLKGENVYTNMAGISFSEEDYCKRS